jgi:hypothetical protein
MPAMRGLEMSISRRGMAYLDANGSQTPILACVQRILMSVGAIVFVVGLTWPWVSRLPFGSLPGDIRFERPGFTFFFPLGTSILLSIVLTLAFVLLGFFTRR